MTNMPEEIFAYDDDGATGTWINFDDSCHRTGDVATKYIRAPQWQPIETAPRDGTDILVCGGTYSFWGICEAYNMPFDKIAIASYCDTDKEWDARDCQTHKPTHWMPLPKPPEAINDD